MIFADIKNYSVSNKKIEDMTFNDFLVSNCKLMHLCMDSSYIEFYYKDRDILDKVYNNCICNGLNKYSISLLQMF